MYTNKKSWVYINISYSGISNCKKIVKFCGSSSQQSHKVHFPASYSFPRLFSRPASVSHSVACLWVNLAEGLPTTLGLGLITGHSLPWWLLWSWSCCRYQPSTQVPLLVHLGCPGRSPPPEISTTCVPLTNTQPQGCCPDTYLQIDALGNTPEPADMAFESFYDLPTGLWCSIARPLRHQALQSDENLS